MNSGHNFNLYIKGNCSQRPHFQVAFSGLYTGCIVFCNLFFLKHYGGFFKYNKHSLTSLGWGHQIMSVSAAMF